MPERKILADNLRKYRKEKHLSQYEMAVECGISKETLSLIERENINPTLETIQKCAAYIGETVPRLLSDYKTIQIGGDNMHFSYCHIKHKANNKYSGIYNTNAIGILAEPTSELLEFLDFIADICVDCEKIENLVYLLNRFEASTIHFRDIVEDYIEDMVYHKNI